MRAGAVIACGGCRTPVERAGDPPTPCACIPRRDCAGGRRDGRSGSERRSRRGARGPRSLPMGSCVPSSVCVATLPSASTTWAGAPRAWPRGTARRRRAPRPRDSGFRGPAHDGVADVHLVARQLDLARLQHLREELSRAADERKPCASSSAPGPSPMTTNSARGFPEPNTTVERPSQSLHLRQPWTAFSWAASASAGSSR